MNREDKNYKLYMNNLKKLKDYEITKEEIKSKFLKHKKEENSITAMAIVQSLNLILMIFATNPQDAFIKDTIFLFIGAIVFLVSGALTVPLVCYLTKSDNDAEVTFKTDSLLDYKLDEELEYINFLKIKRIVKIEKGDIVLFNRFIKELRKEKQENINS